MPRLKLFITNFFVYGFGILLSKSVSFFMLPVLTRFVVDPSIWGIYDIYMVVVSLGDGIVKMGTHGALCRLFWDNNSVSYKKSICSGSLVIVLFTGTAALLLSLIVFKYGFIYNKLNWVVLMAGVSVFIMPISGLMTAPTRMNNEKGKIILISLLSVLVHYTVALFFVWLGMPLKGLIWGNFIGLFFVFISHFYINYTLFLPIKIKKKIIVDILKIGIPLAPVGIIYWVFSSCDRIMIGQILGVEYVGYYGIGARLSSISLIVYATFAEGWYYFAFSTMKDRDHVELMSRVFKILGLISILSVICLLPFVRLLFKMMVSKTYYNSFIIFPYLYVSPLFLMLFQVISNQALVVKKTYIATSVLFIGAVFNLVLNYFFIPSIGIRGAAISTMLSYIISILLMFVVLRRMNLIHGSWALLVSFLLCFLAFINFEFNFVPLSICSFVFVTIILLFLKKDLSVLMKGLLSSYKRKS